MKNKKLIAAATFAVLAAGGLSAGSIASAQSYGSGQDAVEQTTEAPAADATVRADGTDQGRILDVQDADGDAAEGDAPDGARRGHGGGCNLEDAAAAIGIEESALREAVDGGQSIAEVAEANGVDAQDVVDAMVAAEAEHLAEKVDEGRLTQAEADEKSADLESRITDRVNETEDTPEG